MPSIRAPLHETNLAAPKLPEGRASAGTCAAVLPYLSDLGLELVEEILGCTGDNPIANQEQRRALQIHLAGKVLALVERLFDVGVLRVPLQLVMSSPSSLAIRKALSLLALPGSKNSFW